MKKETYEAQKAFAGEKKPSMLRRCVGHDYASRQIYMITMVTEGRRPLFGQVVGRSDAPTGSHDEPRIELSALGQHVSDEWWAASSHHPEVRVLAPWEHHNERLTIRRNQCLKLNDIACLLASSY